MLFVVVPVEQQVWWFQQGSKELKEAIIEALIHEQTDEARKRVYELKD